MPRRPVQILAPQASTPKAKTKVSPSVIITPRPAEPILAILPASPPVVTPAAKPRGPAPGAPRKAGPPVPSAPVSPAKPAEESSAEEDESSSDESSDDAPLKVIKLPLKDSESESESSGPSSSADQATPQGTPSPSESGDSSTDSESSSTSTADEAPKPPAEPVTPPSRSQSPGEDLDSKMSELGQAPGAVDDFADSDQQSSTSDDADTGGSEDDSHIAPADRHLHDKPSRVPYILPVSPPRFMASCLAKNASSQPGPADVAPHPFPADVSPMSPHCELTTSHMVLGEPPDCRAVTAAQFDTLAPKTVTWKTPVVDVPPAPRLTSRQPRLPSGQLLPTRPLPTPTMPDPWSQKWWQDLKYPIPRQQLEDKFPILFPRSAPPYPYGRVGIGSRVGWSLTFSCPFFIELQE